MFSISSVPCLISFIFFSFVELSDYLGLGSSSHPLCSFFVSVSFHFPSACQIVMSLHGDGVSEILEEESID